MKQQIFALLWSLCGALLLAMPLAPAAHAASPCFESLPNCLQKLPLAPGQASAHAQVYASHLLDQRQEAVEHAVIVVHGQGRNADGYFRHAMAGAFLAHALHRTVVISPRIASNNKRSCADVLEPGEANWMCSGPDSWRVGGPAQNFEGMNSFQVMDEILRLLARKDRFPALQTVRVIGHSAGGQYVSRYAMVNAVHEQLGLPIEYVVSNPSSYTYLDDLRPQATTGKAGFEFSPGSSLGACNGFNQWPYGSERRMGVAKTLDEPTLKRQLISRPVTYLLGELDILPLYGFDDSCSAMAQGPTRLARGQAYAQYVNEKLGAKHRVKVVPACGHDARCMFSSETALELIYKRGG